MAGEWKYEQDVPVRETGPIRIPLSIQTLGSASTNLEDLRLMNPTGQVVPYYLKQSSKPDYTYQEVETFDTSESDTKTWIQLVTGTPDSIDSLRLEFRESQFFKTATLKAADTVGEWRTVKEKIPLFASPNGPTNTTIEFDPISAKYLALEIDNTQFKPITLATASMRIPPKTELKTNTTTVSYSVQTQTDEATVYKLKLPARNLPLHELEFDVENPVFRRRVTLAHETTEKGVKEKTIYGEGTLYKVEANDVVNDRRNTALELHRTIPDTEVTLTVKNGDNPPLKINAIRAVTREVSLVFWANSTGNYKLLTGNPEAQKPNYDLANLQQYTRESELPNVSPGPLQTNETYKEPETLPDLPTVGAKIDSSKWSYHLTVPLKSSGVKWMELPPAVLSGANRNFDDVRLARNGRQIPYVLDETVLQRRLNRDRYEWNQNNDSENRLTRIRFSLPYPNLPVTRLTASVKESLIDRSVRLYETVEKRTGTSQRLLARTTWRRTPTTDRSTLQLDFKRWPRTKTLTLEIDNGTNAPLTVEEFSIFYRTHRIFFKTDTSGSVNLLYGRENAPNPDYDLSLVAYDLITSRAEKVEPGGDPIQQQDESSGWGLFNTITSKKGLFWSVMVTVVLALLFAIARLLPEPTGK